MNRAERIARLETQIADLRRRALNAEVRCCQWLADGNLANERGARKTAQRYYDKSQSWLDRKIALTDRIYDLRIRLQKL